MKSTDILGNRTPPSLASKRLIAIFFVAMVVIFLYGQMTRSSSLEDARREVIFMGFGGLDEQTASQELSGNYQLRWQTRGFCSYHADLNGINLFSAQSATSGIEKIYKLPSKSYHIHMVTDLTSDCAWRIKFIPS